MKLNWKKDNNTIQIRLKQLFDLLGKINDGRVHLHETIN
jgi:hypothetical protein